MKSLRDTLFVCVLLACLAACRRAQATPELKFDIVTFCCPCTTDAHMCQTQFDHLNWPHTNGHYIAMGTDAHRLDLATNGNVLAIYYNTFSDGYSTNSGAQQAALIDSQYSLPNFTSTGTRPTWIILNEISASLWPSDPNYRAWTRDLVHALRNTYGYSVILFAPFANPGNNASDWQAVAQDAYIGIENYLSGQEIMAQGFSLSWCQSQYQSSINSYTGLGVPRNRLMLGEHFAHTVTGSGYGRSGVSSNDWDSAIAVRSQAARNVGFVGFLSYAWDKNGMLVSDDEIIHFEDSYRTNLLPYATNLTPPFVAMQPQGATVPSGGGATFTVFPAGDAPVGYQWRFNGTNLAGATTSSMTFLNIQPANGGNYSVVLSNSAGTVASSNALLLVQVPPPLAYEPFAAAQTTYAPGANLIGQTNAAGLRWTQAGPTTNNQPIISSNNLSWPGLTNSAGNAVQFGGNGTSARLNLGTNISSGSLFYSFILKVTDITGISASGIFWAGFNNSAGTQTNTPNTVDTRIVTRGTNGGFNIGLDKSSGTTGSFVFASNIFNLNDPIFLVASYTFSPVATNDDVAQLWINPSAATFGDSSPPVATLTNSAGTDITPNIASFVLFDRNAGEPAGMIVDELRIGTTWASVTPPANPPTPPVLNIVIAANQAILSWPTNAAGFTLESKSSLSAPAWSVVTSSPSISGGQFSVTNNLGAGAVFYRLRYP